MNTFDLIDTYMTLVFEPVFLIKLAPVLRWLPLKVKLEYYTILNLRRTLCKPRFSIGVVIFLYFITLQTFKNIKVNWWRLKVSESK